MTETSIQSKQYETPSFSGKELDNSAPLNLDKRLRGDNGDDFLAYLLEVMDKYEAEFIVRRRRRKATDDRARRLTLEVLVANLVALWLNRVDDSRFLAVPFSTNAYKLPFSLTAMKIIRDIFKAMGLIDVAPGFLKVDTWHHDVQFSRLTRIRATSDLIKLYAEFDVGYASVKSVVSNDIIHIGKIDLECGAEPKAITDSRPILNAINARIANALIELPEDAWGRIRVRHKVKGLGDEGRAGAGDSSATVLRRIFKGVWDFGGRIYGGWWMQVPGVERSSLTINGETVIELDYAQLHPSLVYQRVNKVLDFDAYELHGFSGEVIRSLGKRTFQKLIDTKTARNIRATSGDGDVLPKGITFQQYLTMFRNLHSGIAGYSCDNMSLRLQREDSDLAIEVLRRLENVGIIALPIHDSFIVQARHKEVLRETMMRAYNARYNSYINIK